MTKKIDPRIATARQNIRLAIVLRETTAADVSRAAGLSVNALGTFLRGGSSISYANLLAVCDVLRIPIGILHKTGAVTPGRLALQGALEDLSEDQLTGALAALRREGD
ncbi:helix-turn-helix domain-containing protein [Roseovarius sp. C03]|uniref:helix-turn-helix domain-containing protein n=1 Tax=Roseovarius sp. C03 TaxID=3449222 RepID=UPI003EDBF6C4